MNKENRLTPSLISYLTIRKALGILGIALPLVMIAGSVLLGHCHEIQSSISAYYYTNMRNVFVGIIFSIALFLFSYRGYEKKDAMAGKLACFFAVCVALFPTTLDEPSTTCLIHFSHSSISSSVHFISAAGFFLTLSYFSIFLFTKSEEKPTRMKRKRNELYRICGYIMLACLVLIAAYTICDTHGGCSAITSLKPIFWLETIALWAFGISWLTKGKGLLTDKD
ncbi:MAG TPA: hypothetical protein VE870_07220 [Bacteroidales bacterium]|nr:hypothetical protein [Bacteroidales bacterium]